VSTHRCQRCAGLGARAAGCRSSAAPRLVRSRQPTQTGTFDAPCPRCGARLDPGHLRRRVHACPGQVFRIGTGAVGTFVVPSCRPFIAEGSVSKPTRSSRYQAASEVAAIAYNLNNKVHLRLPEPVICESCSGSLADVSTRRGTCSDWVAHRSAQVSNVSSLGTTTRLMGATR
jgi:hypothetical protein